MAAGASGGGISVDLIFNESTQMWEEKKEPFAVIEVGTEEDFNRLQELVKADREGRVKILAPAMLATCGSCTSFRRTPGTASGICEKREQFKVFQKRPCCKMYKAREDCE